MQRFAALAGMAVAMSLLSVSCGKDAAVSGADPADSLNAFVEGLIVPELDSFEVTLTRGPEVLRAFTKEGYFQFSEVPYGMYVLDVSRKGYGGYRSLTTVRMGQNAIGAIKMQSIPWPLQSVYPSDTLEIESERTLAQVQFRFARKMDRQTVERALRVEPPLSFDLVWDDDLTFAEDLHLDFTRSGMAFGIPYTVTLDTSARTVASGRMEYSVSVTLVNLIPVGIGNELAYVGMGQSDFDQVL
jgi:hypothetical protein